VAADQYIALRPKLLSRQFKQRLLAEEAERQAAEDAAIMAALLIEERARKAALERLRAEDKTRRLAFRPYRPPKLSQQEHAEQKIQECLRESIERGAQSTQKPLNVHLMIVEPERYLTDFAKAGVDHLLVQAEPSATIHLHRVLSQIHTSARRQAWCSTRRARPS
jgi:hypothetical protein